MSQKNNMRQCFFNIPLDFLSLSQAVERLEQLMDQKNGNIVVTPNPEIVLQAEHDRDFQSILQKADLSIPDGMQLIRAARSLSQNPKRKNWQRLTGVDLMAELCRQAPKKNWTIFLLGGRNGVAKELQHKLEQKYTNIQILGSFEGEAGEAHDEETREHIQRTVNNHKNKNIDLLFVAFGAPKQEKWLHRNLPHLPYVRVGLGIGGSFDYLAERVPRAPIWLQNIGGEWIFRLYQQPWRWRRLLKLPRFYWLWWKEKKK